MLDDADEVALAVRRELDLVDESLWRFLWVVDMPSAEWDEARERFATLAGRSRDEVTA